MPNCELEFLLHQGSLPVSLRSASFTAEIKGFHIFYERSGETKRNFFWVKMVYSVAWIVSNIKDVK